MGDEAIDKILEGNFPAEVLDGTGKCIAVGQARLIPGTNAARFWPDDFDPRLDAQLLGPRPKALLHRQGSVYRIMNVEPGDMPNAPKYFKLRLHGIFGSEPQS